MTARPALITYKKLHDLTKKEGHTFAMQRGYPKRNVSTFTYCARPTLKVNLRTSTSGTFAEAHTTTPGVMRLQETLRVHLQRKHRNNDHHIKDSAVARRSAAICQPVLLLDRYPPFIQEIPNIPSAPPWLYFRLKLGHLFSVLLRNGICLH